MKATIFSSRAARLVALALLLLCGLGIRLYDLTDLPLDFHPTRQLLSAIKARGMYYETLTNVPEERREFAVWQWKFGADVEPEVFERLVAFTYQFTGERLWIARVYSSLFWVVGGIFLYLLTRRLVSTEGALASLAFYLLLPYAVAASRSFQPDPLMVMLILMFWWAVCRWANIVFTAKSAERTKEELHLRGLRVLRGSEKGDWLFAILAGLFGGFAIFVKFVAAFFVIGGGIGALIGRESLRETVRRPQVYVMSVLGILPGAAYLVYGAWIAGYLGQQFGGRSFPSLLLSPLYYLGWVGMLNLVTGAAPLTLGLLGLLFFREKTSLRFVLGLWAAYALFGLYFNYHISTHDYYSLILIPILAVSLAPLADLFLARLSELTVQRLPRVFAYCVLLLGLFAALWNLRAQMKSVDYRPEAQMWTEIAEKIGDKNVAGLTQDYGMRLVYWGWKSVTAWPVSGDLNYHNERGAQFEFEEQFDKLTGKKEIFLVTDFDELNRQPFLKEGLYSGYPIFAQGEGYIIFDLRQPLNP